MALMTTVGLEFIARDRSRTQMNSFQRQLRSLGRQFLTLAGVGGGLYTFRRAIESITRATMAQEKAERDLQAALRVTDGSRSSQLSTLKQYASQLQRLTIYGDEEILSQMAYAKNLGVTTDKLKEAATAAIGLAAKYRIELSSAMMLVGRASQGQTQMLTRYGIVMDETLSDQEKFNELLKIGIKAFDLAEQQTRHAEGSLQQLSNTWGDLQETIGEQFVPTVTAAFREMNTFLQQNDLAIKRYISDFREGVEMAIEVQRIVHQLSKPGWLLAYEAIRGPKAEAAKTAAERAPMVRELQRQPLVPGPSADGAAALNAKQMQQVVQRTREAMEAVRHQDYLTRRERIESLRIYQQQNAETLAQVTEANQMLNAELLSLERSRLDAMKMYNLELQDNMHDLNLYVSEKFADTARSIENSMSNAFYSMIAEGATWRDAMQNFFIQVGNAFARMAADMIAQAIMTQIMTAFMQGAGSGGGAAGFPGSSATGSTGVHIAHGGGMIEDIAATRLIPVASLIGAPRLHEGLRSDEFPAILQRGERVIPRDGGGEPTVINNYYIDAIDTQSFDQALYKSRHTLGDLHIMNRKGNHPLRRAQE